MTIQTTDERIEEFRQRLQDMYDTNYRTSYSSLLAPAIELEPGRKYVKVVTQQRNSDGSAQQYGRSVYCFIERETGDILKAAGWKAPAKGKRGSI